MATTHVRCSEDTRQKLTKLATQEGISLAAALDILMNSLAPGDLRHPPNEEINSQMSSSEPQGFDLSRPAVKELLKEVLREEGFNQSAEMREGDPSPVVCEQCGQGPHQVGQMAHLHSDEEVTELIREAQEQAYKDGDQHGVGRATEWHEAIPGVTELRDRWIAANQMVADSPLIKITRAEDAPEQFNRA